MSSLAILGVDGTGKSSVIANLKTILESKCVVQYMGYRDFKDENVIKLGKKEHKNLIERIRLTGGIYRELKRRVKIKEEFPGLIIYDRYVHEIYINASGKKKYLYLMLYKYFFPQPDEIVYLYCSAETSFSRKEDILDKEQFIKMKRRFDEKFLNCSDILAINTEKYTSFEVAEIIVKKMIDKNSLLEV